MVVMPTGMLEMKKAGAFNIAQDEESSVVSGTHKEAIKLGAADNIVPLDRAPRTNLDAI